MENAVDALQMSFAVLIFTIAVGLAMSSFAKAKDASTMILTRDLDLHYYDQTAMFADNNEVRANKDRIVGVETVIPTLYSYFKEEYTVVFYTGSYDKATGRLSNVTPVTLYNSHTINDKYISAYNIYDKSSKKVWGLDSTDEKLRYEPWTLTPQANRKFIEALVTGSKTPTYTSSKGSYQIDFSNFFSGGLLGKSYTFVERLRRI